MSETQKVLYHYTSGNVFKKILESGAITPDRNEPENEKEIPTVTFSKDPVWENSRFRVGTLPDGKLIMMNKKLLKEFDGGLYRIVVPASVAPLDWHGIKDTCNLSKDTIKGIYELSREVKAKTTDWYATTEKVPEDVWLAIERMTDDEQWISVLDSYWEELEKKATEKVAEASS